MQEAFIVSMRYEVNIFLAKNTIISVPVDLSQYLFSRVTYPSLPTDCPSYLVLVNEQSNTQMIDALVIH